MIIDLRNHLFKYENSTIEYKSLKKAIGKSADLKELAKTCVCLANTQGGYLFIGIEDKDKLPPSDQKIKQEEMNDVIKKLRSLTDSVGLVNPELITHENGGEYFVIQIYPSMKTIAVTSDGKVYVRVGDECTAIKGEELTRLAHEKGAFQWELVITKTHISQIESENIGKFINEIRNSDRVSDFIKKQADKDILEYYRLVDEDYLTNLGILWLGNFKQRSKLNYPITVQYIVYDEDEKKIRKIDWSLNQFNPKELLLEIEKEAIELNYSFELPDGMFRKQIRHYAKDVVRELLVNAFVHKSFTISGDIFISLYKDRLEIKNPGGLPLGVTKDNILHQVQRRNPHLIDTFKALKLMENEGSGVYPCSRLIHSQKRYHDRLTASRYDGFQNSGVLTLRWQPGQFWQFFASFEVNREQTKEKASSSHKFGGTLGIIYRWKNWSIELSGGYAKRYFEGKHYLYGYKRVDNEYRANWSLWNEQWTWKGLMPKLNFSYVKIHSNMPDFYSRKNGEWFLTVEKRF